jgi:hypothetical protein
MTLYVLDSHKEMVDSWRDRNGTLHKRDRRSKRLHTADMTPRELARVVAGFHGWKAESSGWIRADYSTPGNYDAVPICQGWSDLGTILQALGIIEVGKGVYWRRMQELAKHETGRRMWEGREYSKTIARLVSNGRSRYLRRGVNA